MRSTAGRFWASALAAALLAGCAAGTRDEPAASTAGGPAVVEPPPGAGLLPVTLPDFDVMEAPVRAQMEAARAALAARIAEAGVSPAALGDGYGSMGQLLMAATHFEAAEVCYRNAETLAPDDRRWPYYLGQIYNVVGPLDRAVTAFERALELAPDDVATLVRLGEAHLAAGRPDTAAPLFTRALALTPGSAAARFGAGRAALAAGDPAAAARELELALAAAPQATGIHYPLALAYRGLGDLDRTERHLAMRGDLDPQPVDPLMRELDALLESAEAYDVRGGQALDEGNWTAAAGHFRRGLALDPANTSLRHRLGTALFQLGDPAGAEREFAEVIRRAPDHARAHFSLGVLMAASGRDAPAIERFASAIEHDPGYQEARLQLAAALARSGRADAAIDHYVRVLERDPTRAEAAYGRAMALVRLGRYLEARDRLAEGMETFPGRPVFPHALARILAAAPDDRVRDGGRARALVEPLLATDQSLDLGETIAMTLAELGDFAQAAAVQRDVMRAAEQAGLADVAVRLADNLSRYERGEPCRTPWTEDELP